MMGTGVPVLYYEQEFRFCQGAGSAILTSMTGPTQRTPKTARSDALANRQRILDAAREVFARRGLDAEIREIAERAGVGIGTLYRHFESREGLLSTLVHQAEEDLLRRIQPVLEIEEPRAAVRTAIRAGAEFCEQFGALTEVMLRDELDSFHPGGHDKYHAGGWEGYHASHPDFMDEFKELLANLLQRGMRDGTFRPDLDVPVAVAALMSILASGMLLALATQRSYPRAADDVADFFLAAIEAAARDEDT
jgi:AcrR family transcriptional regulator